MASYDFNEMIFLEAHASEGMSESITKGPHPKGTFLSFRFIMNERSMAYNNEN